MTDIKVREIMANYIQTDLPAVIIIEPTVFEDDRGYFFESYRHEDFPRRIGKVAFRPDHESKPSYAVLRAPPYHRPPFAQSKLVRVIDGMVLDVAVDIRRDGPTFGRHVAVELSGENRRQLFIPRGYAHGFVVLTGTAIVQYKVDAYYSREHERGLLYNDPAIGIDWQIKPEEIILSDKDRDLPGLGELSASNDV